MPSSAFARSSPSFCDWLKERSLNLPMSLTSATSVFAFLPPALAVDVELFLLPPPQPAASTSTPSAASAQTLLRTTAIALPCIKRTAGPVGPAVATRIRRSLELRRGMELPLDDLRLVGVHQ